MKRYTSLLYQIVYSTKYRRPILHKDMRCELFKHISGLLKNKRCHLYQINGVEDHLHILTDIHPTIAISNLVKDIKLSSTDLIKRKELITKFTGWQIGYGGFTYSINEKNRLIEYIKNQEQHHQKITFEEEYRSLLREHNIEFDERYLFDEPNPDRG